MRVLTARNWTAERPQKHSLTLRGHQTSVSLEPAFWRAFKGLAVARGKTLNGLAAEIDDARGTTCGLASAIRLFVLAELRQGGSDTV